MLFGKRRQKAEFQRQSSDESCSSTTSPSKSKTHHRRMPSFAFAMGSPAGPGGSDISVKSSATNVTDPLNVSLSSTCSAVSQLGNTDYWPERKAGHELLGGEEGHSSSRALEIIRQLSFSPPRKTKKRADTASSTSTASTADTHEEHGESIGLDLLQQLEDIRMGSPSPLLGLQYLPEENMFI